MASESISLIGKIIQLWLFFKKLIESEASLETIIGLATDIASNNALEVPSYLDDSIKIECFFSKS